MQSVEPLNCSSPPVLCLVLLRSGSGPRHFKYYLTVQYVRADSNVIVYNQISSQANVLLIIPAKQCTSVAAVWALDINSDINQTFSHQGSAGKDTLFYLPGRNFVSVLIFYHILLANLENNKTFYQTHCHATLTKNLDYQMSFLWLDIRVDCFCSI